MLFSTPIPSSFSTANEIPASQWSPPLVSQAATAGPILAYVVENDYISSVITELIVKKNLFGSKVQCYANGQWAFDELLLTIREGSTLPDLIVLDLDMPLMDGWEFLDALTNLGSAQSIRVFVQTSSIHPDDRSRALSYKQVAGFFSKPLKEPGVAHMLSLLQQGLKSSPGPGAYCTS